MTVRVSVVRFHPGTTPISMKRKRFPASPAGVSVASWAGNEPTIGRPDIGSIAREFATRGHRLGVAATVWTN